MNPETLERCLETARTGVSEAARQVRNKLADDVTVARKGTADFVSSADLDVQRRIVRWIRSRHPDHEVLAEEMTPSEQGAALRSGRPLWVVDPIDGTTNFLRGLPDFCVSAGLVVESESWVGAVAQPVTGDSWWGIKGGGAWHEGPGEVRRRLTTSDTGNIADSLLASGHPFKRPELLERYVAQYQRVLVSAMGIRQSGCAALDLCRVASGHLDGYWEMDLGPWDFAAGTVIVHEAGGVVGRLDGAPLDPSRGSVFAAATQGLGVALQTLLESS